MLNHVESTEEALRTAVKRYERLYKKDPGAENTFKALIQLEDQMKTLVSSVQPDVRVSSEVYDAAHRKAILEPRTCSEQERDRAEADVLACVAGVRKSISDLLHELSDRIQLFGELPDVADICRRLNIVYATVSDVILPPDNLTILPGDGSFEHQEHPSYPKFGELIRLLCDHEVFTDDIIVIDGGLHPNQMREESYLFIEIPRLDRTVLLCNAYGEASFVYQGILSRQLAFTLTKSELQEKFGNKIQRIIFSQDHLGEWRVRMAEALFFDREEGGAPVQKKPGEKRDVKTREECRQAIFKQFPDAKDFMRLKKKQRLQLKICDKGLVYIANSVFGLGIKGPCNSSYDHALLARAIYGEGIPCIESVIHNKEMADEMTPEDWKEEIRGQFRDAKDFMELTAEQKLELKIRGKGLSCIANSVFRLWIKDPCHFSYNHALLARAIYGEGIPYIESVIHNKEMAAELTPEDWKEEIRRQFRDAEKFMKLTVEQRLKLKIYDYGLIYIANSVFGLRLANPCGSPHEHAFLARAIYGEGIPCIESVIRNEEMVAKMTPEEWKEEIRGQFRDAEKFMKLTIEQRLKLKIYDKGLYRIANSVFKLGLEKDPCNCSYEHALLARAIYGEGHECIESVIHNKEMAVELTPEECRKKIYEQFPTAEDFMGLTQKQRLQFKICDYGLGYIANSVFGLGLKNPCGYLHAHALLARVLYGEGIPCIESVIQNAKKVAEMTPEDWKKGIYKQFPTADEFMNLEKQQRLQFKICDYGLKYIANVVFKLGLKNPCGYLHEHALLAQAIYGEGIPCIEEVIRRKDQDGREE